MLGIIRVVVICTLQRSIVLVNQNNAWRSVILGEELREEFEAGLGIILIPIDDRLELLKVVFVKMLFKVFMLVEQLAKAILNLSKHQRPRGCLEILKCKKDKKYLHREMNARIFSKMGVKEFRAGVNEQAFKQLSSVTCARSFHRNQFEKVSRILRVL
jgi:hypothetical protein